MGIADKIFGSSKNKQLDLLTGEQKQTMNNYLNALKGGAAGNVETLQGYADEGFNPYDSVAGDALVEAMRAGILKDRNKQLSDIKGSHLNRFSTASQRANADVFDNTGRQRTELDYRNLLTKADFNNQAYQNQTNAIRDLFGMSNSLINRQAFQNQTQYNPGFIDRMNQASLGITNIGKAAESLSGGASSLKGLFAGGA